MSNQLFMFDYLPSFYRNFMVNDNGQNILLPLFEQYANAIGDALYQSQQLSSALYLNTCPIVTKEYFKIINIKESNKVGINSYKIESDIIGFSQIYYDVNFNIEIEASFNIYNNSSDNSKYITFNSNLDSRTNILYAKYCYKDKQLLKNIFGKLLNYQPNFDFMEYGENFINTQENYRNQLLAILYNSIKGQSIDVIAKSLSIFLGLKYAPFNAIVRDNSGTSITLENIKTGNLQTINGNIKSNLIIGTVLNKYDILENDIFKIYDIYSDPARFTQYIIGNKSAILLNLLNIDIANQEQYAFLTYDSMVSFDNSNIYWDMGNNTGVSHTVPVGATNYPLPTFSSVLNNFSNYNDSRFDSQKIYEMFRNIFIIQMVNNTSSETLTEITTFLNRFKPIYTNFLLFNAPS